MGKVVCVSGFFDPLHFGHVDYLQKAKDLAFENGAPGTLWVIVNSDKQAAMKKGRAFMPQGERLKLLRSMECVDAVMIAPDDDESVCRAIEAIQPDVFAIGLDEGPDYMKDERETCKRLNIEVVCPLGVRIQSSSFLIEKARKRKRDEETAKEDKNGSSDESSSKTAKS